VSLLWSDELDPGVGPEVDPGLSQETSREGGAAGRLVPLVPSSLARAIVSSLDRRVQGLVVAAARARKLAPGTDAVTGAEARGQAALIVVATDAAAGAELSAVRRAVSEGRAVSWGTKRALGALCSGADSAKREMGLAVIAIKDDRIAAALREAVQAAAALLPLTVSGSRRAHPEGAAASRKRHDAHRPGAGEGDMGRSSAEPSEAPSSIGAIDIDVARSGQDRRADG
jgi:ribosomal protein L7Ae-like RNA K-turn-binding protein